MTISSDRKSYLKDLFLKKGNNIHIGHWLFKLKTAKRSQLFEIDDWLFIEELFCLAKEVIEEK